ncbi:MAG: hypothetical protein E7111_00270 [Bacteroidales bacterium]|nr:hypothetical protein [Bacteroidales bacterium]
MKRGVVIILLCFLCTLASGSEPYPRFTYGGECSYIGSFLSGKHQYFYAPEGFREEIRENYIEYHTNTEAGVHIGYNFNPNWNLSLHIGYTRLGKWHPAIPVTLRATRYFGTDPNKDRWFGFVDFGSGVSIKDRPQEIITGKIGGGYRLSLSRCTKLDFIISFRLTYTHPDVVFYDEIISRDQTITNNAYISGLSFGIGITF